MPIGSAALPPLLRRHASSAELKSAHAASPDSKTTDNRRHSLLGIIEHPDTREITDDSGLPLPVRKHRKPSPGLAARLKALGFGRDTADKKQAANETTENIGRIPEDQIRSIDSLHRANSTTTFSVPKRGRTWTTPDSHSPAASSPAPSLPATTTAAPQIVGNGDTGFTSIESTIERAKALNAAIPAAITFDGNNDDKESDTGDTPDQAEKASRDPSPAPRVEVTDMSMYNVHDIDAQKYRLPEHVNGCGTKAMPATKMMHLEREDELPPPPPISKEEPEPVNEMPGGPSEEVQSYFNPFGLPRPGSVYSLSRVSFASQLAQLTSLQLPDAESLATRVAAIPTSRAATQALTNAAEQIKSWICKAFEVLDGLDAEDDVEWAAAAGRGGLEEVDNAISRFNQLINVYVNAIEGLQQREDIGDTPHAELTTVVGQVENILDEWARIKRTLNDIKDQVGVAIEWEELWTTVMGDIGDEMDTLCRLVFEMEEKRHQSIIAEASQEGLDIADLDTIEEESTPASKKNRLSVSTFQPASSPGATSTMNDDSSLLALCARMQPLRASLDFLPMRLASFHQRAEHTFPTACEELEARRDNLEASYKTLEQDADSLRREIGEDRWVLVFRSAGGQANKMYDSVGRSLAKVREAIDAGQHMSNMAALLVKIENYESKKIHYGPSIERVLSIIEKGVQDRLTINGEIVRLHSDMQKRWQRLKEEMFELDQRIAAVQAERANSHYLYDSVSSLVSNDRSTSFSSTTHTPGSSPASSVILSSLDPTTPGKPLQLRGLPTARRTPGTAIPRTGLGSKPRSSGYGVQSVHPQHATPSPGSRTMSTTPTGNRLSRPSFGASSSSGTMLNRPRWNTSVKTDSHLVFKPLPPPSNLPTATQLKNAASGVRSFSEHVHGRSPSGSKIPLRKSIGGSDLPPSPLSPSSLPIPAALGATGAKKPNMLSFRDRMASSPGPYSQHSPPLSPAPIGRGRDLLQKSSLNNLRSPANNRRLSVQPQASSSRSLSRRSSMQPEEFRDLKSDGPERPVAQRAASSMASRRSSLLPTPGKVRGREPVTSGRDSRAGDAVTGARAAMRGSSAVSRGSGKGEKERPKWK